VQIEPNEAESPWKQLFAISCYNHCLHFLILKSNETKKKKKKKKRNKEVFKSKHIFCFTYLTRSGLNASHIYTHEY
jgi:hypothetical protein